MEEYVLSLDGTHVRGGLAVKEGSLVVRIEEKTVAYTRPGTRGRGSAPPPLMQLRSLWVCIL